ncbi:MAG: tRNA adenosine(34) deaminase TadA [Gammaproteobacteria bacterium]|nr:tRNA adenosine(34) deaminase TadA [Gammaproteobacteria bacterium]
MSVATDNAHTETDSLDLFWMQRALELADHAASLGEVPIGALLVKDDQILGEGWNCPISSHDPSAHAEINALRAAARQLGNYRLLATTLYVTVEPCLMCIGALIHARVNDIVYAAREPKSGAVCSAFQILDLPQHNHRITARGGVMAEPAVARLQAFFRSRR